MSDRSINNRMDVAFVKWRTGHVGKPVAIYLGREEYRQLQAYAKQVTDFFIPDAKLVTETTRVEFGGTPVFEVNAENHLNIA